MNRIPAALAKAIVQGLTIRDYAVLVALVSNKEPMTRQEIEEATGLDKSVVVRSTIRLYEMGIVARDRGHVVGGSVDRASRYSLL